jgi:uncharacterized metal-binding protein
MSKHKSPLCTKCLKKNCFPRNTPINTIVDIAGAPNFCPMKISTKALEKSWNEYQKKDIREFARQASIQEAECYEWIGDKRRTKNTRIEETIQLAKKLKYKKLGIVFCGGLTYEAVLLDKILENEGFEVVSVSCKTGGIAKEKIGLKPSQKVGPPDEFEPMCNPIAQAEVMNQEKPDWVILLGLCVGHDTLFIKYCKQPITVLAAKDRVLAHNPLGALYLSGSPYYGRLLQKNVSQPPRDKH